MPLKLRKIVAVLVRVPFVDDELHLPVLATKKVVDFCVLFLQRSHSSDRPALDSNPLPTDYKTRALANTPPETFL